MTISIIRATKRIADFSEKMLGWTGVILPQNTLLDEQMAQSILEENISSTQEGWTGVILNPATLLNDSIAVQALQEEFGDWT